MIFEKKLNSRSTGAKDTFRWLVSLDSFGQPSTHRTNLQQEDDYVSLRWCQVWMVLIQMTKPSRFSKFSPQAKLRRGMSCHEHVALNCLNNSPLPEPEHPSSAIGCARWPPASPAPCLGCIIIVQIWQHCCRGGSVFVVEVERTNHVGATMRNAVFTPSTLTTSNIYDQQILIIN
jgi:hypothetical protein